MWNICSFLMASPRNGIPMAVWFYANEKHRYDCAVSIGHAILLRAAFLGAKKIMLMATRSTIYVSDSSLAWRML
jgi:hypothetical protein